MFDKLFGIFKKPDTPENDPAVSLGRYSDNNKPLSKIKRWNDADALFKEKKYKESLVAFFDYLRDDALENVNHRQSGAGGTFELYQGSKIVRGFYNEDSLEAEVTLAGMLQPSVAVMRRLLEMNFNLYYSRFALNGDKLCMRFDSGMPTANPSKLYYSLKEMATRADKQDDLLLQDFTSLQAVDTSHVKDLSEQEKEVKFRYFQKWIKETLDMIATLDADKFSGGIAYLILVLVFSIDYLIVPEGKILTYLEKIVGIYFAKDERPVVEKNGEMIEYFNKLQAFTKTDFFTCLISSKYTFSIVNPQGYKTIADVIQQANQNMLWYRDNNYPVIAAKICEYGISYSQYSYSLPRPVTELFQLFMMVNYADYFTDLGFKEKYYYKETAAFNREGILARIENIEQRWQKKYPDLRMKKENLRFDSLVSFNHTFTTELQYLNMDKINK